MTSAATGVRQRLDLYRKKRNFRRTSEPEGKTAPKSTGRMFVIQKHAATRLHYDFRLEMDGVLKSWAVPKGPSVDPADHRLAVHVEDHPIDYGSFEGTIPKGEYGGGTVMLWDQGSWEPLSDPHAGYKAGKLKFELHGKRLKGRWILIRMNRPDEGKENWLLIKEGKESETQPVEKFQVGVLSGRTMEQISKGNKEWRSNRSKKEKEPAPSIKKTGARRAPMPAEFHPELATLVESVPPGDGWLHEIKFDGYRVLCFIENGNVRLITRNGKDWTDHFSPIAAAAKKLRVTNAIIDGEIVVENEDGTTDFQSLQNYLKGSNHKTLIYQAFDLPYFNSHDLTALPLIERKELLKQFLDQAGKKSGTSIHYSGHIAGSGADVLKGACRYAMEGIISKRADSPYVQDRTHDWVKVKCIKRQEFVIGGFTEPQGARRFFGSLLIGFYDDKKLLRYCGHVGTGFDDTSLKLLHTDLKKREQSKSPFSGPIEDKLRRVVHWVKPDLVCEVEFTGWTEGGNLRHPSFVGLREDKHPKEIGIEKAQPVENVTQSNNGASVRLTHPDRVLFTDPKLTKQDLADYYQSIQQWILPHLQGRPLTLVRCPDGQAGKCFYQKHSSDAPKFLRRIPIEEKESTGEYLIADDIQGVLSLVQMGVLEIHVWGSTDKDIERPDRIVMDLDPAPGVPWKEVVTAARRTRERLEKLGLQSFVKTTGGKGLHVVAPIVPDLEWDHLKQLTKTIAKSLVLDFPENYLAEMRKSLRKGKIFIDYLRNGRGATSVAPFSTRAKPGAPVSMPLRWDELSNSIEKNQFTVETANTRMARIKNDPWEGFFSLHQKISESVKKALG